MDITQTRFIADATLPMAAGSGSDYLGQVLADVTKVKGQTAESLHLAGQEFEAYFLANLMRIMRETVHEGFLENKGGKYFYPFYDTEIGRLSAQAGGIGLSRVIDEYARQQSLIDSGKPSSPEQSLPIKGMDR